MDAEPRRRKRNLFGAAWLMFPSSIRTCKFQNSTKPKKQTESNKGVTGASDLDPVCPKRSQKRSSLPLCGLCQSGYSHNIDLVKPCYWWARPRPNMFPSKDVEAVASIPAPFTTDILRRRFHRAMLRLSSSPSIRTQESPESTLH